MEDEMNGEREALGLSLEKRGGVWVVQFSEGGCRPASIVEVDLWQALQAGRASLAANAGCELVAWAIFAEGGNIRLWSKKPLLHPSAQPLYAHPSPQAAQQAHAGATDSTAHWNPAPCTRCGESEGGHYAGRCFSVQGRTYYDPTPPAPSTPASVGWISVKDQLPPCRDDQDYIGINSAGFAGIFNAIADIAGNVYCMMETAEESVSIMSDLSIWKPFTRPLPASPTIEGESNG